MNISELARKLKTTVKHLKDVLPQFGFHIGQRAIKVDMSVAQQILEKWPEIMKTIEKKEQEKKAEFKKSLKDGTFQGKEIEIPEILTVGDFAKALDLPVSKVMTELIKNGILATINERIDFDTASIVAEDLGKKVIKGAKRQVSTSMVEEGAMEKKLAHINKETKVSRPPVVVVMGHVDHGKTTLLDTIRSANVAASESGGITQHIGAYQVKHKDSVITFLDTPGHEAFTAMRSRGAKVADIAILVVAADDSVKQQTIECIRIIESAKIPYLVAINKVDKPDANLDKVKTDLSKHNIVPEEWGGKAVCIPVSALKKQGISELLDAVMLQAEMNADKIVGDPKAHTLSVVIEANVNEGEGAVATLLIKTGTLHVGDQLCVDEVLYGRVRQMKDSAGNIVKEATPSMPVRVLGLKIAPHVGDLIEVLEKGQKAKKLGHRKLEQEQQGKMLDVRQTLKSDEEKTFKTLPMIIKADVIGSLEAILAELDKLSHSETKLHVVSKGLGNINETDILQAITTGGIIFGFKVDVTSSAYQLWQDRQPLMDVRRFDIIYDLVNAVKMHLEGLLEPELIRETLGTLEVLAVFKREGKTTICGGKVTDGRIAYAKGIVTKADIYQKKEKVGAGRLTQLQSAKQDVPEVRAGQECGLKIESPVEIQEGMKIEFYRESLKKRTL